MHMIIVKCAYKASRPVIGNQMDIIAPPDEFAF